MTQLLVSVQNVQESLLALSYGVDLIDLKAPQHGALGNLIIEQIATIVEEIDARAITSATLGDIPPDAPEIVDRVIATAACGVDYVKVAMLNVQDCAHSLRRLASLSSRVKMIAVLFAEDEYPEDVLQQLAKHGFVGVMWDTRLKNGLSLLDYMALPDLQTKLLQAKQLHLITGIAGSLSIAMWSQLSLLAPNYLGFRGGLCDNGRGSDLSSTKLQQLLTTINSDRANHSAAIKQKPHLMALTPLNI